MKKLMTQRWKWNHIIIIMVLYAMCAITTIFFYESRIGVYIFFVTLVYGLGVMWFMRVGWIVKLRKNTEGCDGYCRSNCCDAIIYEETDVCGDCKEHCDTECSECEDICEDWRVIS